MNQGELLANRSLKGDKRVGDSPRTLLEESGSRRIDVLGDLDEKVSEECKSSLVTLLLSENEIFVVLRCNEGGKPNIC